MTGDQTANRTQGETHGREQVPVEAAERDTTQREQARHEGEAAMHDPATPDAEREDSRMPAGGGESQLPGDEFVPRDEARDEA